MRDGLTAIHRALDAADEPVTFFVRDDDAGWDDGRLLALLDCVEQVGVPIDLAVIPQAAGEGVAAELRARVDRGDVPIGLHQHGWTHANHEGEGRKCEFGDSRDLQAQRADLLRGRDRLHALFGSRIDPVFTPPWNRCNATTLSLLPQLGFAALSRDRTAWPQRVLPEIPVGVDWCRLRRDATATGADASAAIGAAFVRRIGAAVQPIGLMLHHAAMDESDLELLRAWLPALRAHPQVRWASMRQLLTEVPV